MNADNYWTNRNVSLLGGAGPIGTHIAKRLLELGVKGLRIVDDLSAGKFENVRPLIEEHEVEFWVDDLREYPYAQNAVRGADVVFHLASQHGGRGYVSSHDVELYDNLSLDVNVFRACAEEGVEKVIFSSSACAYPVDLQTDLHQEIFLKETDIDYKDMRQADGAYGTEKLVGELMLDAYIERGCFQGCATRSSTVYGPLSNESHAIEALIAKVMIRQNPIEMWGTGSQIRDWTFIEDNADGAILAAEKMSRGAINISRGERLKPIIALNKICEIVGWYPDSVWFQANKPVGPLNRVADNSELLSLGWIPKYTFEQGLKKTIEWYLATHNVEDVRETLERKLTER